jgi:hypothetical protein
MAYPVSTLHCMTVSLAQGGAGPSTAFGEQIARRMLADAGFLDIVVHEAPGDLPSGTLVSSIASLWPQMKPASEVLMATLAGL